MIGALSAERRRCSELPSLYHHRYQQQQQQQHYHKDAAIAAAAAEGARMISPQMTPPRLESIRHHIGGVGQILICICAASMLSLTSIWMALSSKESMGRKAIYTTICALCALLLFWLAFVTFKRRRRKPVDDIEISQSILREHRKSMTNSLRKSTAHSEDFIQQIRRHSSVIAVDAARQKLLAQQQQQQQACIIKSGGGGGANLLSVESPVPKRATSTSN